MHPGMTPDGFGIAGAAPMKVEIGPGRRSPDSTPARGGKTPGSRRNRGNHSQQSNFGAGQSSPVMDPMNMMNMQMMYSASAVPPSFMGMPPVNPWAMPGVPPFLGNMPGHMPMFNPVMGGGGVMPGAGGPPAHSPGGGGGKGGGKHKGGGRGGAIDFGDIDASRNRRGRRSKVKGAKEREASPERMDYEDDPDRSPALNLIRKDGAKSKMRLSEALPHIIEFARDQHGSRFLQGKLDEADRDEKQQVFEIIKPHAAALASESFANFVIQKFFDVGSVEQRKELVHELFPRLLILSNETHGCRVVQKAIQHVPRESQLLMATKLRENVVACIESMHGNHVIQKCIEQMPPDSVTFIIQAVEAEAQRMASHMYGCRIVQRLLEHCASHQLQTMLDKILGSIHKLATDPYGNYVVQHMLEHGRISDKQIILSVVESNILEFSKHKCSSNVVEKALEIATVGEHATQLENERASLMSKVIGQPGQPNPLLCQMMDDRFGNFIVQRMIEHARGPEREGLREQLQAAADQLQNSSHGKHILNALKKESMA